MSHAALTSGQGTESCCSQCTCQGIELGPLDKAFKPYSGPDLHAPTMGGPTHSLVATDYFFQIILEYVGSIRLFYCSQMKWSLTDLES